MTRAPDDGPATSVPPPDRPLPESPLPMNLHPYHAATCTTSSVLAGRRASGSGPARSVYSGRCAGQLNRSPSKSPSPSPREIAHSERRSRSSPDAKCAGKSHDVCGANCADSRICPPCVCPASTSGRSNCAAATRSDG